MFQVLLFIDPTNLDVISEESVDAIFTGLVLKKIQQFTQKIVDSSKI